MNNLIYFTVLSGISYRVNAGSGRRGTSENKINIKKNTHTHTKTPTQRKLPKQIVIHNRREGKNSEQQSTSERDLGSFEFGGKRILSSAKKKKQKQKNSPPQTRKTGVA